MGFLLKNQKGLTFLEVVCVLLLIGILSAVIITRTENYDPEAIGGREQIKNYLRFSQLMAMSSNTVCGVVFDGSVYWVFRNGSTSDKITLPHNAGENIPIDPALGSVAETIYFDMWGRPFSDASLSAPRATGGIGGLGITMYGDTGSVQ